ncbi:NYN domain-containing protein [Mycolicibacterium vanbaalenii]|uniref:Uncharacterized protein n=1 Tax=Mycolicibacterium vanbaalenii (strain DSM 7251 / JCM 13017 / BCRC 16820 / KCTC 9966 / NRRL B-24157 / PYR-1) TaxID=350058 RepID=A1THW5_MYCVP|nr:NYN domain-containing protein [Mycolicibacterium vanbaalenii]ABM16765.1 hypothetical protein Mvan_6010 [Mycolicibacterium vanbaalenii PYR-1]MCV7126956.1 NYN domain-containing protein [Mycolicibacterium vanbaalenii PYR-1]
MVLDDDQELDYSGRPDAGARHLAFVEGGHFRTIHLLDIENLIGGSADDEALIAKALHTYEADADPKPKDTLVVGVPADCYSHLYEISTLPAGLADRGCNFAFQIVVGGAPPHGVDQALLTAVDLIRRRSSGAFAHDYGRAKFATGGHVWSALAEELRAEGVRTSTPGTEGEHIESVASPASDVVGLNPEPAAATRTIHVIDIENLVGGWADDERLIATALKAYEDETPPVAEDTVIVGIRANFHPQLHAVRRRPPGSKKRGCRFDFTIVVGHNGKNGADQALETAVALMRMRREAVLTEDYDQASIASGDFGFAALAADLQSEGMSIVHTVGRGDSSYDWHITVEADEREITEIVNARFRQLYPHGRDHL